MNPKWCITFFLYDNKWYDETFVTNENKFKDGYISLAFQRKQLLNWLSQLDYDYDVKIFFIEVLVENDGSKIHVRKEEKMANGSWGESFLPNDQLYKEGTNEISLKKILESSIGQTKAERNMLITIGHGSIFGINLYNYDDDVKTKSKLVESLIIEKNRFPITVNQKKYLEKIEADFLKYNIDLIEKDKTFIESVKISNNKLFENIINDNSLNELLVAIPVTEIEINESLKVFMLTNKEIDICIKDIFNNQKKLDILVLDSCLMQNIFTQYELKESVDYLIASQSGITFPGHNYMGVIKKIIDNPSLDTKIVANSFKTEIKQHPAYNKFKPQIEATWCFSTIKLDKLKLEDILIKFNDLFEYFISQPSKDSKLFLFDVKNVQSRMFKYDAYSLQGSACMVDIRVFFKALYAETSKEHPQLKKILEKLNALNQALTSFYNEIVFFKAEKLYNDNIFGKVDNETDEYIKLLSAGIPFPIKQDNIFTLLKLILKKKENPHKPNFLNKTFYEDFISNLNY